MPENAAPVPDDQHGQPNYMPGKIALVVKNMPVTLTIGFTGTTAKTVFVQRDGMIPSVFQCNQPGVVVEFPAAGEDKTYNVIIQMAYLVGHQCGQFGATPFGNYKFSAYNMVTSTGYATYVIDGANSERIIIQLENVNQALLGGDPPPM